MACPPSRPPSKFRPCYASSRTLLHGLEQAGRMRLGADGMDRPSGHLVSSFPRRIPRRLVPATTSLT